jgi:hypothetical protein
MHYPVRSVIFYFLVAALNLIQHETYAVFYPFDLVFLSKPI